MTEQSIQDKADLANQRAYSWTILTYPHMIIPFLPIQPNNRLTRAIARIFVSPQNKRHIEYAPLYFEATDLDYCIKVLKHEYTHLVCYIKNPNHFRDGDKIFERELRKHHLENNYNDHNRDYQAAEAIHTAMLQRRKRTKLKSHPKRTQINNVLSGGHGLVLVCSYCGKVVTAWKKPQLQTVFHHVCIFDCPYCHYSSNLKCYLLKIVQPTTTSIIKQWAVHQLISDAHRQTFEVNELFISHDDISMKPSRMQLADPFNYAVVNFQGSKSATRIPADANYRLINYPIGHGWIR